MFQRGRSFLLAVFTSASLALAAGAAAEPTHDHHQHEAASTGYQRSVEKYSLPQLNLIREDGKRVEFPKDIDDGRPVVLNFVYTTCTAICPMLSQTFAEFQKKLGSDATQVRMASVSIDPEQDTPKRLAEYARRYEAGPQWTHYTGTLEASVKAQRAFKAYFGDKMHHRPVIFLRAAPGASWVRLDGFVTPDDLLKEYRQLVAAR
ncbi:MAG TPA: SCO family protein [Burkholderiales bacterium]